MRYSGDWMVLADDRILEYIRHEGSGSPKQMKDSGYVRFSRQYISRRCKKMVDHGLLQHLGNGVYVITEIGEEYLDGELDTSTENLRERGVDLPGDEGAEGSESAP